MKKLTPHNNPVHCLKWLNSCIGCSCLDILVPSRVSIFFLISIFTIFYVEVLSQCDTEVSGVLTYCNAVGTPGTTGYFVAFRIKDPTGDTLNVVDLDGNNVTNRGKRIDDINTQQEPATVTIVPARISGVGADSLEFWYFGPYANGSTFNIALIDPNNDCDTVFVASGSYDCMDNTATSDPMACNNNVPLYFLDFSQTEFSYGGGGGGNENFDETFLVMQRSRVSSCCDLQPTGQSCFEFIIRLGEEDIGLAIDDVGSGSTGGEIYADTLNMFQCTGTSALTWPFTQSGGQSSDLPLCIEGGGLQEFVVLSCKSGSNVTGASIDAISNVFAPPKATAQVCNVALEVFNIDSAFWSSDDDPNLDNFLSCNPDSLFCSFHYDSLIFGPITSCEGDTFVYIVGGNPDNGCVISDTIVYDTTYVVVYPSFTVEIDSMCNATNDSLLLTANIISSASGCEFDFFWSTGDTTESISVLNIAGQYSVTVSRSNFDSTAVNCLIIADTIDVLPTFVHCDNASDEIYECVDIPPSSEPELIDAGGCGSNPLVYSHDVSNGGEGCQLDSLIITRYYIIDFDGDTTLTTNDRDSCIQRFIYVDNKPPTLIGCPANITIQCTESTLPPNTGASPTATDNCDPDPDVSSYTDVITAGACPQEYTITRTWTATDACGNSGSCSQIINVDDSTPPVISCPANVTIECSASTLPANTGFATATDNCTSSVTPTVFSTTITGNVCLRTITRVWRATDACGNSSTCTQIITAIDNIPPVIACPQNITISCASSTNPSSTGTATATDNCDLTVTVAVLSNVFVTGSCPQNRTLTRTWRATDDCNNSSTCVQIITLIDNVPPSITCPPNVTISCTASTLPPATGTATSSDNCDITPTIIFNDITVGGACSQERTITRTWRSTDDCGNFSTCVQTIVVDDFTPPVITCPVNVTINCQDNNSSSNTGVATATDNCSGVTITQSQISTQNPDSELCSHYTYQITRTWVATDGCGNSSSCVQLIQVQDITPPIITCPIDVTINCQDDNSSASTGVATATDICSGIAITESETSTQDPDVGECGHYSYLITRTWVATDECGNNNSCVQLIQVQDVAPPAITCPIDVTINCEDDNSSVSTGMATATDICSGISITESEVSTQNPDVGECGHYSYMITRTWVATDECGNSSNCVQLIQVQDITPPIITCPVDVTINCQDDNSSASTGVATSTDICSGVAITESEVSTQDTDVGECAHYSYQITRTWVATDGCGNSSSCVQLIQVQDITPPVISCAVDVTVNCEDDKSSTSTGVATATDLCSGVSITESEVSTLDPDVDDCGHYSYLITRTWVAIDECGNSSSCVQLIHVQDITPPVITCPIDITINCQDDNTSASTGLATATDICSGVAITESEVSTQDPDVDNCEHYTYLITRTWVATDECGNSNSCVQLIQVQDITTPVITCPVDVTINCQDDNSSVSTGVATATDLCSGVTITESGVSTQDPDVGECGHYSYLITRTWLATDECGNSSSCVQLIQVQDITPPVITCPVDVTINCQDDNSSASIGVATATDLCSGVTVSESEVSTQDPDDTECGHYTYQITRTWVAIDECGNSSSCVQLIQVQDITPPAITCPIDVTINCEDDNSSTSTGVATATDICSGVTITESEVSTQDPDLGECGNYNYLITRTWVAVDECGNSSTCVQLIQVQDITPPAITCPIDVTINCQDDNTSASTGIATATDICSGVAITETEISTQDSDVGECGYYSYLITRTWVATDECGNSSSCVQLIQVQDITPPAITCPVDVTINCQDDNSSMSTGVATATDICSGVAITESEISTQNPDVDECGHYSYLITRTWVAVDECGNSSSCVQLIQVQDLTPPVITCPIDVTLNCQDDNSSASTGIATATDICSGVDITESEISTQDPEDTECGHYTYQITRTWLAIDECGNSSSCVQLIQVQDITPPVITCPIDVTINCQDDNSSVSTGVASAIDICSGVVITESDISTQDPDDTECGYYSYLITRTWVAVDECGNSSSCVQLIQVQDITPPAITCPIDVTINCQDDNTSASTGIATATDICSGVAITESEISTQDPDVGECGHYSYLITRTWVAVDECGNSSSCVQLIQVQDITPPVITCPIDITINCQDDNSSASTGAATATDICSGVAISESEINTQDPDVGECGHYSYLITRTWVAVDECGNSSSCVQLIQVQDITPPVITCPIDVTINCQDDNSSASTGLATATDICSGVAITESEVSTQDPDVGGCGHYSYLITRTWVATDECGNSNSCVQLIQVQDITPPVITCPIDVTLNCEDDNTSVSTGIATGTDICSGVAISESEVSTQDPDVGECGYYSYMITRTWVATDECGNSSSCVQFIQIQDITPPAITCPIDVTINCQDDNTSASTGVATATDICSGVAITESEISTQDPDVGECGHYSYLITRTWVAVDECGNSTSCVQLIQVQDITPPVITCPVDVTLNCQDDNSSVNTGVATATDICSGVAITESEISTQDPDVGECGHYSYLITRTWVAVDECGNSNSCVQLIQVQDVAPPAITCPIDITLDCQDDNSSASTGVATATDICSGVAITESEVSTQDPDVSECGHYTYQITRTWVAIDECGNSSSCVQLIQVQDVTPPAITCPFDVTLNCQDDNTSASTGIATATDICSGVAITESEISTQDPDVGECGHYSYQITRTWVATDECGNSSSCVQLIQVQDITSPVITCPIDVTINCQDDNSSAGTGVATATDICSGVAISESEVSTQDPDVGECGHYSYQISRTWVATDECGNSSSCVQLIQVQDITPPVITCPIDVTINCQDDNSSLGTGIASATDLCSGVVITESEVSSQDPDVGECDHYTYLITRTWVATDECGNSSSCIQLIQVQDIIPPVISCPIDITLNCQDDNSSASTGIATATDICSGVAITESEVSTQDPDVGECGHYTYLITRTWVATDECGNSSSCVQLIQVQDVTPPPITCPTDITLNCQDDNSSANTGVATATDICSGVVIAESEVSTQDPDDNECGHYSYLITRIWVATDECGNSSSCVQLIQVQDVTPPAITCPIDVTVNCQDDNFSSSTGIATATDICSGVVITESDVSTQDPDDTECGHYTYQITRTWVAIDECGNSSSCEQLIQVQDVTPPAMTCPVNVTVNCQDDNSSASTGVATGIDICSGVVITESDVSTQDPDDTECGHYTYQITRTWVATDDCGNSNSCIQLIYVQDVTPPVISCPIDATVNCHDDNTSASTGVASGMDICSGVAITESDVSTQDPDIGECGHYSYLITRTWFAIDECGNSSSCVQLIQVQDVTPPAITCPIDVTINCQDDNSSTSTGVATGTDNCSGVAITESELSTQDPDVGECGHYSYLITRTWVATDECGNANSCVQLIHVQDLTPPAITCPADVTVNCQDDISSASTGLATATDLCSGVAITESDVSTQDLDDTECGYYTYQITRTWVATDECGNSSSCVQIIQVQDVTPPVITCPIDVTLNCQDDNSTASTGVATATDICSAVSVTESELSTQDPDVGECGHYTYLITRTWVATDVCGNSSSCVQLIHVQDVTPPVITCPIDVTLNCQDDNSSVSTGVAAATDICSGVAITESEVSTQDPDIGECGHYTYLITRTWVATDECGNSSSCVQLIQVQDITTPVITCPVDVTINCQDDNSSVSTGMATATDICSGVTITESETSTQDPNVGECGHYTYLITRTWLATDECGNSNTCVQLIQVQDVTPPVITCPIDVTINCQDDNSSTSTGAATGTDICSGVAITESEVSTQDPDEGECGHYTYQITRTWVATDECGNSTTCVQGIQVQDVTPPVITCPADITIVYPASTLPSNTGFATSTDNCDDFVQITNTDIILDNCPQDNIITRTWWAVDACGNSSSCQQTILIEDHGSICGKVEDDLGQPLANITIQLISDINGNEIYDLGDTLVTSVLSASGTGNYCFNDIKPCNYILVEIQPATYGNLSDYDSTPDPDGDDSIDGADNEIPVTLSQGESDLDNNFIDIVCPTVLPVIPPDTICDGSSVVFQTVPMNPGPLTYSWNFGSGSMPSTGNGLGPHTVSYDTTSSNQMGGALVTLSVLKAGCPDLVGQVSSVEINPYPNASFNGPTAPYCYYTNHNFQPNAPIIPGATYNWNFGTAAVPATATGYGPHPVYYTDDSIKTVKLVIHPNEPGAQCIDSSSISFNVLFCPASIAGNVRSVTGGGIQGVTIRLFTDNNLDGIADNNTSVKTVQTTASGTYTMTGLTPGSYVIVESQPSLWYTFDDRDTSYDGDLVLNIDSLDNLIPSTLTPLKSDAHNFFRESAIPGTITGSVFNDGDNDQLPDNGEGIENAIIYLHHDNNKDGDADMGPPVDTAVTSSTGFYSFLNVPVGNYVLTQTSPPGYESIKDYDLTNDLDSVANTVMNNDTLPITVLNLEHDQHNYFVKAFECTLVVANANNAGPGSLRYMIGCAESGETITFDTSLQGDTIYITTQKIVIDEDIILECTLLPRVTIASQIDGLFEIGTQNEVEFRDIDIISGILGTQGAAFYNFGILELQNVSVFRNPALPPSHYLIINTESAEIIYRGNCYLMFD